MDNVANSTIAALCYAQRSKLEFPVLVRELGQALKDNPRVNVRVTAEYDDFVVFDMKTLRICLAHCNFRDEFPEVETVQTYEEALIISVGSGPDCEGSGPMFEGRADVCRGLVERVESHHPSDRFLLLELDEVFSEDVYDMVLERIWPVLTDIIEHEPAYAEEPESLEAALTKVVKPKPATRPDDIFPDLEARFDAEMAEREAKRQADERACSEPHPSLSDKLLSGGMEFARKLKPTHPAMAADREAEEALNESVGKGKKGKVRQAAALRHALYPPEEELPDQIHAKPLVHRAAIYAMNSSLVAFALPVGAAILTYSILGRENLATTSRVTALTGAGLAFANTEVGAQVLSYFV